MKIEAGKAKERQATSTGGNNPQLCEKSHEAGRADEETAKQFGISSNTLRKEIAIVDNRDKLKGGIE